MKNIILIFTFSISLIACNKRDPNPEKKDQLFLALEAEIAAKISEKTQIEGELTKAIQAFKDSEPQTGQVKTTRKKVYDWEYALNKVNQEIRYLELRKETRAIEIKKRYLKSFVKDEQLDTSKEYEEYVNYTKRRMRPKDWRVDVRIKEEGLERKPASATGGGHEPPPSGH